MDYIKYTDLFGNDITEEIKKENIKQKSAVKRRNNREKLLKEIDKNFDIAYCTENGDLFGNLPTEEERVNALNFLKEIENKFKKKKHK